MKAKAALLFLCPLVFTYYLILALPAQASVEGLNQDLSRGRPYSNDVGAAPVYPDAGGRELTNGVFGTVNYADPAWSGYGSGTPSFTVDLGTHGFISEVSLTFLSYSPGGIYPPSRVDFEVSTDGVDFIDYGSETAGELLSGSSSNGIFRFRHQFISADQIKFVRVSIARNQWLFIDEIVVSGSQPFLIEPPLSISGETSVSFSAILAEWLDVDDLISKATSAGVSSVDLWVGYSGIAWFDIDGLSNRYGLIESNDGGQFLLDAIDKLHQHNIKVTAVISSQLWGPTPQQRPPPCFRITVKTPPTSSIPKKAKTSWSI